MRKPDITKWNRYLSQLRGERSDIKNRAKVLYDVFSPEIEKVSATPKVVFTSGTDLKKRVVYRFFWGRSNLYKNILHFFVISISIGIFVTGVYQKLYGLNTQKNLNLSSELVSGNYDLLEQGGGIETVLKASSTKGYKVWKYKVADGDTIDTIKDKFGVTKDTIKWANQGKIDYYEEKVNVGDELEIPEINGVLYSVKSGDTLDSVMAEVEKASSGINRFDVIEVNNLEGPTYSLAVGASILIPDAKLLPPPPPPPVIPEPVYSYYPTGDNSGIYYSGNLNGIQFVNPVGHPSCAGYSWNRGFTPWHNGVDLGRNGGCNLRAAASGTVIDAGWGPYGEGYHVTIDHGNGVQSLYYHGDGNIWVRQGDYVAAGQEIMYMGCSGYCTGTHLHLGLRVNYVYIDPQGVIPY
jgi:murein DD-endopeptidase MepM/ murein hydrolase activator NlpD